MFYKKGINCNNNKQMFEFLQSHFTYYVVSWYKVKHYEDDLSKESIANNVKIYRLNLEGDPINVLRLLEEGEYDNIFKKIDKWEKKHPGYLVVFNGCNNGYLVLKNERNNKNILPNVIYNYSYEEFKEYCLNKYGGVKNYNSKLREYVKIVRDFDKLCDDLRNYVNKLSLKV